MTRNLQDEYPSSTTRRSLIVRVCNGEELAWREFVAIYAPLIGRWCHRFGLSHASIADVTQEVFMAIMSGMSSFDRSRGTFRGWLWQVTRNKIIDRKRSAAKRSLAVGGSTVVRRLNELVQADEDVPISDPTDASDQCILVRRALELIRNEFHTNTWNAFWRTTVDDMPIELVAQELAMSNASVRQARSRIGRRLKIQLGELE